MPCKFLLYLYNSDEGTVCDGTERSAPFSSDLPTLVATPT